MAGFNSVLYSDLILANFIIELNRSDYLQSTYLISISLTLNCNKVLREDKKQVYDSVMLNTRYICRPGILLVFN